MRFLLLLLACGSPLLLSAQNLHGRVLRADSAAAPVPFASVGVKGKAAGTVADARGRFRFPDSPELAATDSVVVTAVGYRPARLLLGQLRQANLTVRLQAQPQVLREVTVRYPQLKPQVLGRTGTGGIGHWQVNSIVKDSVRRRAKLGSEFGTFITSPRNCYVDDFNVYVQENPFRQVQRQRGWIKVDLRPYNLQFSKGQKVVVALQWLDAVGETPNYQSFDVPALLPSPLHLIYTRDKSQANWKFYPARPSIYLNVQSWK